MSLPLIFHPDVQDEIDEARLYYEQQKPTLGDDFLLAIEKVFRQLEQTPEMHQVIWQDVRRALSRRFPYAIYYRVYSDNVNVIAVQHTSRDPARWQSRA